jgi:murein L,D-transpeptidase YafK
MRTSNSSDAPNGNCPVYIGRMKLQSFPVLRLRPRFNAAVLALIFAALACAGKSMTLSAQQPALAERADSVLILKKDHVLELLAAGKVIRTYKVALGQGGLEPKQRQGDGRTPEGHYIIDARNSASEYHLSLHISYPNAEDRKRAAELSVAPGGDIMIHGLPNGKGYIGPAHRLYDWTLGCIAVTDGEIEEIWKLVPVGTPVEIRP